MSDNSLLGMHQDAATATARAEIAEIADEQMRTYVEVIKAQLRAKSASARWWHRFFPFVITIRRRDS